MFVSSSFFRIICSWYDSLVILLFFGLLRLAVVCSSVRLCFLCRYCLSFLLSLCAFNFIFKPSFWTLCFFCYWGCNTYFVCASRAVPARGFVSCPARSCSRCHWDQTQLLRFLRGAKVTSYNTILRSTIQYNKIRTDFFFFEVFIRTHRAASYTTYS